MLSSVYSGVIIRTEKGFLAEFWAADIGARVVFVL